MKKLFLLAVVVAVVIYFNQQPAEDSTGHVASSAEWQSNDQVSGEGTVSRILADDNEGDRHQRFILTLDSGRTLLIAHNIDVAPRIDSIQKGGVVHWTHHDPYGHHEPGWLRHRGRTYQ